jgi:hypothetical protein
MIVWRGNVDMFTEWTPNACPIIPTNLTPFANAGIAKTVRKHTPKNEFQDKHEMFPGGGLMAFTNGKYAWDLPTKRDLRPGSLSDIELIRDGLKQIAYCVYGIKNVGVDTLLLPKVGSGLGGLNWQDVWEGIADIVVQVADVLTVNIYSGEMHERPRIRIQV